MPFLHLRVGRSLTQAQTQSLAERLTAITHEHLHKRAEVTAVQIEPVAPTQWFIGATSLATLELASFQLEIQVTEGTNTKAEKAAWIAAIWAAMKQALGALHPASYAVIQEVRADAWGFGGVTQERRAVLPDTPMDPGAPG
jgi:4-oxalocrotonate tautomerase